MATSAGERGGLFIEPFVDEGLGNSAYLVGVRTAKVAAVIDPLRDVDAYIAAAEFLRVTITHVVDTHLHNDFLTGAREIAARTGAEIGASAEAGVEFDHRPLKEGDRIRLGDASLGIVETPGHTPEHIAVTAFEMGAEVPSAVFSGGALIVGGAARTDLLGHDLTEPLARRLFHTIHDKLLKLPDSVVLCPTHGAGSFCAAPATDERTSTIGQERWSNPLCQPQTEDEFVIRALEGLPSYPVYFRELRPINRHGPKVLRGLPDVKAMPPREVKAWVDEGGAVLDVRHAPAFADGHIPGAYGIAAEAPLVTWAGWLIPFGTPLVLVAANAAEIEAAVRQLVRIGYDDLRGHLHGGMVAWRAHGLPIEHFPSITAAGLHGRIAAGERPLVLDVRSDGEWERGHIPGAIHIENGRLPYDDLPIPKDGPIIVQCGHYNRAAAGLSILARRGYRNLTLFDGGFSAWRAARYEVERGTPAKA